MRATSVAFFTAVTNALIPFSRASRAVEALHPGLVRTVAKDRIDLSADESVWQAFLADASQSDILIVQLMGGTKSFPRMHEFIEALPNSVVLFVLPTSEESAEAAARYATVNVVPASIPRERWEGDLRGLDPVTISLGVMLPELDGSLISVPVAFKERLEVDPVSGARYVAHEPHLERIDTAVSLALKWARLRRTANREKRVAILFHNYPPGEATIGTAYLLDSVRSVWNIARRLAEEGYAVENLPGSPDALIDEVKAGFTGDPNWSVPDGASEVDTVSPGTANHWVSNLPDTPRDQMSKQWGVSSLGTPFPIPGRRYGNVYVGIQPPRGFSDNAGAVYHSPDIPPPYGYYVYYRWIREVFEADAVLHIAKHGSLEWLPGKGSGLSAECFPDVMLRDLPNIYPYIINNPGEGTQAKRRSAACIVDHNVPILDIAGEYEGLAVVNRRIEEYNAARTESPQKLAEIRASIIEVTMKESLHEDVGIPSDELEGRFDELVDRLHDYLGTITHTFVRDGLHCFGEAPVGEGMRKMLYALTRLPDGEVPSFHDSVATAMGPSEETPGPTRMEVYDACQVILERLEERGWDTSRIAEIAGREVFRHGTAAAAGDAPHLTDVLAALTYIVDDLRPRLLRTTEELDLAIHALQGGFVPAGPSGSPSRGMAHLLPTGRNFYSVDPRVLPTEAAWEVGGTLAEELVTRYRAENGDVPRQVGIVVWGSPTIRTKGDDIAEILHLLGVRPIWNPKNGYVTGLEPMAISELGRPRIDVTIRISGFFRDAFPQLVVLLDNAVRLVAGLEERETDNPIRAGVAAEAAELAAEGHADSEIRALAAARIFGPKPGAYGAGVSHLVDNKNWKDMDDLARVYIEWGSWTYSALSYGVQHTAAFTRRLSGVKVVVKNVDHRESDIMDSDHYYQYHGGMVAAVASLSGTAPACYIGDSSDPRRVSARWGGDGVAANLIDRPR